MGSFKSSLLSGMKWTTLSAIVKSVVKLLQVAILTRFLPKSDFGTIAIAVLFIGFTELFLDMGISSAILHKQDTTREEYSSLFWLNILTGLFLTGILWILSPLVALYYNDESLTLILRLLSLNVLISSIGRQHHTIRQKKLNFKFLANVELATYIGTFLLAVLLAYMGYGVFSLVYSTIFSVAFPNIINCAYGIHVDGNIHLHFKLKETYPFLKIGVYKIGSSILDYFSREFDILIISATLGRETLGVYSLCKKIVHMIYNLVNPILTKVLTPMFAKIQNDKQRLTTNYLRIVNILATTNHPVYILIAILSTSILNTLYGPAYVEGQYALSLLAVSYGLMSICNPVGTLQVALGRTDIGFYWTIFRIITNTLFIYVGALFSINGLALAILAYNIFVIFPFWYMQYRPMLQISFLTYLKSNIYQFIVAILCAIPFVLLFYANTNVVVSFIIGIIYISLYITIMKKVDKENYILTHLLAQIKNKITHNE